jgi:hypothetical protein
VKKKEIKGDMIFWGKSLGKPQKNGQPTWQNCQIEV